MSGNEIKTPIGQYKREVLRCLRKLWKSEEVEIWRGVYTFIKHYIK